MELTPAGLFHAGQCAVSQGGNGKDFLRCFLDMKVIWAPKPENMRMAEELCPKGLLPKIKGEQCSLRNPFKIDS